MDRLVLTFLLWVSLSSGADATVSSIRTISGDESTTFSLPESKTWVLALRSAARPKFNYKYYALGRLIANDTCDECYRGSLWAPFVTITEKWIKRYDSTKQWFEGDIGSSQARSLSITTKSPSPVELQELLLPLKNCEIVEVPFGGSVNISLPDKEEVWLALWNDQKDDVYINFNLYDGTGIVDGNFTGIVEEGWLIIRIYENKIFYPRNLHALSNHRLKGRLLELHNRNSLKYQLFSMPFEPNASTDTSEESSSNIGLTVVLPVVVSLVLLLLLGASYLGHRFGLKRNVGGLREGPAQMEMTARPAARGGLSRPGIIQETENPIYGLPRLPRPWR